MILMKAHGRNRRWKFNHIKTNSCEIGYLDGNHPHIIPSDNKSLSIPSKVIVTPNGEIYAGNLAENHPDRYNSKSITISSVKRMMGKKGETGCIAGDSG